MEAALYLGTAYDEGKFISKSDTNAYRFLSKARDLGVDSLHEKLVELAIKIHGRISDETCQLFEEKTKI